MIIKPFSLRMYAYIRKPDFAQALGAGQGWPSVPVAKDGEKGPLAEDFGWIYTTYTFGFVTSEGHD